MNQQLENTSEVKPPKVNKLSLLKTKEEMRFSDYLRNYSLELLAFSFWLYALNKIFIFNVDNWIVATFFPNYSWALDFKLICSLGLACIVWLCVGTRDVIVWVLYVALYPLVLLFIRLPYFIFKQQSWLLAFAVLNAVASFFKNLKYGLVFSTIFLVGFSVALFSQTYFLYIAIIILVALVLVAYVKSFLSALKPTIIFQIYTKFFKGVRKWGNASFVLDDEIRTLAVEEMKPKQLDKWNANLQSSVLFNRVCLLTATRLREYQKSDWKMIPSILGLLWLIVFNVVSFSGIYFSLFKLANNLFVYSNEPTFFTFLYFSFNNLVLNSTPEFTPALMISQVAYMLQASLSFLLVVIIAAFYVSHRAQKASSELDEVIVAVEAEATSMESFIKDEYKIPTISIAMERLKTVQYGMIQFIFWLSKGIK